MIEWNNFLGHWFLGLGSGEESLLDDDSEQNGVICKPEGLES
jgi:hypothetical protein